MTRQAFPLQLVVGDLHGLNTLAHQPVKVSAMEGLWETQHGAPQVLFGWPAAQDETTRYAVEIPKLSSLILTHDLNGEEDAYGSHGIKAPPPARKLLILSVKYFNEIFGLAPSAQNFAGHARAGGYPEGFPPKDRNSSFTGMVNYLVSVHKG